MDATPFRYGWWNIPISLRVIFFVTMAFATSMMVYGILQRIRLWRMGQPEAAFDRLGERFVRLLRYGVAQVKVVRQRYPAIMHLSIFWAMVLLFMGTVLGTLDTDIFELVFSSKLLQGNFYLLYKVVLDLAALACLVGLALALYRRYIVKPERLNTDWRYNLTLPLLTFILLSGLCVEALRLAAMRPAWAPFSLVAYPFSLLLAGAPVAGLEVAHRSVWIVHYLAVGGFIATLPWTNLFHLFSSPANIFVAPFRVRGALHPIADMENSETFGVSRLNQIPWPRLVNVDACTECGRCQVVCPAHAAGQPLNPKQLVLDLRSQLSPAAMKDTGGAEGAAAVHDGTTQRALVGDVISHETVWSCTTCYACVHECPVLIEQVDDIVDMRRYLALMQGDLPQSLATTLTNIERTGNPWKQSRRKRAAWTQGLGFEVPIMSAVGEADVLWWVGCAGAYDPRNQKVTRALARILHRAGVTFAILGEEEQCTGDAARRAGNEYLFQTLAKANIELLGQYKFKVILTQCPHCYNTLRHEYRQFGGNYQVVHHTEYIQQLLATGKLPLAQNDSRPRVTFHDPCYLGRYNDIYAAPRDLVAAAGGALVEMAQTRDRAMCCGGGGSRVWMEDDGEERVNRKRLTQVQATGAEQAAVACPFCMIMLEDAKGALGADALIVRDVAEMVADRLADER